jgi:peptide deformylase
MAPMPILPIVRLGDPVLRAVARPLDEDLFGSRELRRFVKELVDTMRDAEGVGLAAPQVGASIRVFVFEAKAHQPAVPLAVAVNPRLEILPGETIEGWEGCLSIPGLRGLVPRHAAVELSGFDVEGRPFKRRAEGFEARIIQHELDHLDGVVYLDRMRSMASLGFLEELDRAEELEAVAEEVGTAAEGP